MSKANKLSPSRQHVLAFERLGIRALLSATPIQPMVDDSAALLFAIPDLPAASDSVADSGSTQPYSSDFTSESSRSTDQMGEDPGEVTIAIDRLRTARPSTPSVSQVTPTLPLPGAAVPTPTLTVRNAVRELRPKVGRTETDDMSVPPYFVTTDGVVDVTSLLEGATWRYSIDGGTWIVGSGSSLTLPVAGPQRLAVEQIVTGSGGGIQAVSTLGVVVDPDWDQPVLVWSGTLPAHYHGWHGSRVILFEDHKYFPGRIAMLGIGRDTGSARDINSVAVNSAGYSSGALIDRGTYRSFRDFLPKTQRDRLVDRGQVDDMGKPVKSLIPKGTPLLLNGNVFDVGYVTVSEVVLSLEVFLQSDINGDGSVAGRPASVGGVRVDATMAQMSEELAGDTQLVVYSARGIPGVTGRVYMVGESGLTADNTYDAGDLEDYKVLRLSNGKPISAPTVPVALRPNASGVEVLFSLGTASPTYQSRVFSLQSGRAIGKPSAIFRDIGVLEAEYATDLNGDQVIGNAITIAQVLDPSNLEPDANDEASIGVYRVSGVPGVTGSVVAVGDANLQSGQTYVDADLARMTVLRGTNGKPLGAGFTPVAVRDDGAQVEVLFKPSPSSTVHQTQRFNATSGRAIGRPSKPVQNLASIEGVFAQDLNVDGVIGAAFTVTSVVDDSGAMAGGGPGNYGLYWVAGLRQGPSLVVSDRGLVAGEVYQEGDVGTTIELVSRKGAPLASGFPAVAISESGDTVDVLYRAGAAYQTQRFNIASGRAVGVAGPVRSDVASLEDEFDQDLNDDGTVGASAT